MNLRSLSIEQLEALKELKLKELREIETVLQGAKVRAVESFTLIDGLVTEGKEESYIPTRKPLNRVTVLTRVCPLAVFQLLERNVTTLESWEVTQPILKQYRYMLRDTVNIVKNKESVNVVDQMEALEILHNRFMAEYEPLKGQKVSMNALDKRINKIIDSYLSSPIYKEYMNS